MNANIKLSFLMYKRFFWLFTLFSLILMFLVLTTFCIFNISNRKMYLVNTCRQSVNMLEKILYRVYEVGTYLSYDPALTQVMEENSDFVNLNENLKDYLARTVRASLFNYCPQSSFCFILNSAIESAAYYEGNPLFSTNQLMNITSSKTVETEDWYIDCVENPYDPVSFSQENNLILATSVENGKDNLAVILLKIPSSDFEQNFVTVEKNSVFTLTMSKNESMLNVSTNNPENKYELISRYYIPTASSFSSFKPASIAGRPFLVYSIRSSSGWIISGYIDVYGAFYDIILIAAVFIVMFTVFTVLFAFTSKKTSEKISSPLNELCALLHQFQNTSDFEKLSFGLKNSRTDYREVTMLSDALFNFSEQITKLFSDIEIKNEEIRNSEIKALQSQINPHFLYNTLDAISWKCLAIDEEIPNVLSSLSQMLRYSLKDSNRMVHFSEELNSLENYLEIIRFSKMNNVTVQTVGDQTLIESIFVPKITLQPIVENCILHGISKERRKNLEIRIEFSIDENYYYVAVMDNGSKPDLEKMYGIINSTAEIEKHGIKNVHKRLQHFYGNKAGLLFSDNSNGGCTVTIRIPHHF